MTVIGGILCRSARAALDESLRQSIRGSLSRRGGETVLEFGDDRCFLAKIDVGAFGHHAHVAEPGRGFTIVAGAPLLSDPGANTWRPRSADVRTLHDAWCRGEEGLEQSVTGTFAAAHYAPASGTLRLTADKLALRPLYWWANADYAVFGSALRILTALPFVPRVLDLQAATEIATWTYALDDRTPYAGIHFALPAESIVVTRDVVCRSHYWRWDTIEADPSSVDQHATACAAAFRIAVARRAEADSRAAVFLSGGLDSRAVVAALRQVGIAVRSLTMAREGSLDLTLARVASRALGTEHAEQVRAANGRSSARGPTRPFDVYTSMLEAGALEPRPDRPRMVWTGDGGSVAMGSVYLSPGLLKAMREGDLRKAARCLRGKASWSPLAKVLSPALARRVRGKDLEATAAQLGRFACPDPGQAAFLHLLWHDQRRHVSEGRFGDIDLHRTESLAPFLDSDLVSCIARVPVDERLHHRFYLTWLRIVDEAAVSVPWQAYPGHVPCPHPMPVGARDQWSFRPPKRPTATERRGLIALLGNRYAYSSFFRRGAVLARLAAWIAGLDNHRKTYRMVAQLAPILKHCQGRVAIDGQAQGFH